MKPGDTFFIVPAYNFDRQERKLVKLISKSERIDNKYRSYQYEVEIMPSVEISATSYGEADSKTTSILNILDSIDQGCK